MKRLFVMLIICFAQMAIAQNSSSDVQTVLSEMKAQELAWNDGDIPGFMEYYWKSDSLKFISSGSVVYGWHTTIGKYLKSYPTKEDMGTLNFTIIEATQLCANSIFIIGKWELIKEKPAGGHFTLVWKKLEGKWVIVTDHTS